MGHENPDDGLIRRYLLGQLAEGELEQLEEKMMADNELFSAVLLAEDEMVEEYVDGELPESDRPGFEASFLSTPEGRQQVTYAKALRKHVAAATDEAANAAKPGPVRQPMPPLAAWWKQLPFSPSLRLASTLVIVLGLGLGIWRVFFYQSDVAKGTAVLAYAYREQRPVEARISGFNYAPAPTTRGDEERVDRVARNRAERILLDAVSEHPSPASHHALGRLYLAEGKFDDAIAQFEEAVKADPNNAQLHNDYGAALLELGKAWLNDDSAKSVGNFAKALEHLSRAVELDGSLLEALFNRALCRQYMVLTQQAEKDWSLYLERDPNSRWADEARQHLKLLEEQKSKASQTKEEVFESFIDAYESGDDKTAWRISSQNREALSGRYVAEQLLNAYVDLSLSGQRKSAGKMLEALLRLGELEEAHEGDSYTLGLARFYRSLSPKHLETLSPAQQLMSAGRSHYAQGNPKQAIEAFTTAKQIFSQARDKWEEVLADYWIAYSYSAKADAQHSWAIYEQLEQTCKRKNFKWLLMRTHAGWSVLQFIFSNYSKAIEHTHRALELAEQMNDDNGAFNAWSYLIEYYRYIGNYDESLRCVQRSLPFISTALPGKLQRINHYAIIASAFNSAGFYSAAINYQEESVSFAKATDNPATRCVAYVHLGLMYSKAGNNDKAIANMQLAYEIARSCPDEAVSKNQMAYAALQMGNLYREAGDFARAVDNFDESIGLYEGLDYPTFYYQAHKGKFICYIAQQNDSLAGEELQTTVGLIEKYRSTILEGDNRNGFFDIEQSVYDLAIDFEYTKKNDPRKAFEYSEASRARSLLDLLTTNTHVLTKGNEPDIVFRDTVCPLPLSRIEERLPDQVQILQYCVLPNKILIWAFSRTGFSIIEKPINQEYLNERVLGYLRLMSSPTNVFAEELSQVAKELSEILIAPAELLLDRNRQLCIVPDKILCYLPFAALISASSNRYLIEDFPIIYSPSSSVLIFCSEQAERKKGSKVERLLSVGNPSFDHSAFPSLVNLPSAATEAEGIASYYGSSHCLLGSEARKNLVIAEMEKSDVIHFALHSLVDERSPMLSKLVLANQFGGACNDASQAVMESHEIYDLKLPRARLVVLSACQTGVDRYYKGEGMISIARPFIVAGVPIVVASLWPVDSDSTMELMISFHKYRKRENVSTSQALRLAQLEMLSRSEARFKHPNCWASFIAIGGHTTF